jgi:hypothetical protein
MEIIEVNLDELVPYERNLRKNGRAVARMVASIKEYGFKIPLLARHRGEVIELVDGVLRQKAARKLKMTRIPVIFCDEWSEAQVKSFRLLVNRSATWATWDLDLVALEMADLNDLDFDLNLTGFDPFEIDQFLFPDAVAADETPDTPGTVVTLPGDFWNCGEHRVGCTDGTKEEGVATLFRADKPKLLLTDPPFGVSYQPDWREQAGLGKQRQTGIVRNDDRVDWRDAYRLFTGDVAYVFHAGVHAGEVAAGLEACGFQIRAQIIWLKQHFALSRGDFHWAHEPCWYAVRKGKSSNWCGDRKQSTVWNVPNLNSFGGSQEDSATGHSTQKPVELMRRAILNNTRQRDIIYDPFLGGGSVLIAAALTDRVCYGLEIDPGYVDVIVRRWQDLTGKQAVLEADGRTFEQVAQERRQIREALPCPGQD